MADVLVVLGDQHAHAVLDHDALPLPPWLPAADLATRASPVSRFVFAPGAVGPMIEDDDVRRLDEANAVLRATLREVRDELTGAPLDEVLDALTTRLAERVDDEFSISASALRDYAAAISEGTLFG